MTDGCDDTSYSQCVLVNTHSQELKGKFLIKGKRLNKLEACFAPEEAAADGTVVTEEEDSNDDDVDEQKEKEKSKVGVKSRKRHIISANIHLHLVSV